MPRDPLPVVGMENSVSLEGPEACTTTGGTTAVVITVAMTPSRHDGSRRPATVLLPLA